MQVENIKNEAVVSTELKVIPKLIGAKKQADALGVSTGAVKALHIKQHEGNPLMVAHFTGKNVKGTIEALALEGVNNLVSADGMVNVAVAVASVKAVAGDDTATVTDLIVNRDLESRRVVPFKIWVQLGELLQVRLQKATAKAEVARLNDAIAVYNGIVKEANKRAAAVGKSTMLALCGPSEPVVVTPEPVVVTPEPVAEAAM